MRRRGGGGGSFGVVLKWQVRLVTVPATVSVFKVSASNSQGAAVHAVTKWQKVAPALPSSEQCSSARVTRSCLW